VNDFGLVCAARFLQDDLENFALDVVLQLHFVVAPATHKTKAHFLEAQGLADASSASLFSEQRRQIGLVALFGGSSAASCKQNNSPGRFHCKKPFVRENEPTRAVDIKSVRRKVA